MGKIIMSPQNVSPEGQQHLREISQELLKLHKLLLDEQRALYEKEHGRIGSPGEFLNLVIGNEQFEWLRQLSGLIVEIDEIASPRSKAEGTEADSALQKARQLLTPSQDGTAFQRRYWQAIQDLPDILIAHREITKLI